MRKDIHKLAAFLAIAVIIPAVSLFVFPGFAGDAGSVFAGTLADKETVVKAIDKDIPRLTVGQTLDVPR